MRGSAGRNHGLLRWVMLLCSSCAPPATPSAQTSPAAAIADCTPVASASPPPQAADARRIATGLDASLANLVLDGARARLTARAASFLHGGHIWNFEYRGTYHPSYACIGELPGAPSVELGSAEAFLAFARGAGLRLDDDVARVAYVKTYLELEGLDVVESGSDIPFAVAALPNSGLGGFDAGADADPATRLQDELRHEVASLLEKRRILESRVVPSLAPLCLHGRGPFWGVVHALDSGHQLLRLEVALERDGTVTTHGLVVARDLPVRPFVPCAGDREPQGEQDGIVDAGRHVPPR
jgi:hypothetical protein